MATWVTHFRIAENLIQMGLNICIDEFVVGNIGPDCGLPTENGFFPPKEITHFMMDKIPMAELFYDKYLNKPFDITNKRDSFLLGYYAHLITDQEWIKLYEEKKKEKVYQDIYGTPEFSKLVKKDWYGLDFLYLKENKEHIFWSNFQYINKFPDYLDIFEAGQVMKQIKRIQDFYLNNSIAKDHEYKYLTMNEVDQFVSETTSILHNIFSERL